MPHLIEIRDLKKIYAQGEEPVHALDGVSLDIDEGEFVAIMGASGSGKSTMLNILGCLDTPTSGSYMLDGLEVARRSRKELAVIRNKKLGTARSSPAASLSMTGPPMWRPTGTCG